MGKNPDLISFNMFLNSLWTKPQEISFVNYFLFFAVVVPRKQKINSLSHTQFQGCI
jgi:hypothetical protein